VFLNTALPNIIDQLRRYLVVCVLAPDITYLKTPLYEFSVGAFNKNKLDNFFLVEPLTEELMCQVLGVRQFLCVTQFFPVDFTIINFLENLFEVSHASDSSFEVGRFQLLFRYF
jgi:hypothetical protein